MRPHVTIGEFSRASHLRVKTLRHYHEVGLLEPSEVDRANGYRYYAEDQIPVAQVIRRLRGLEMPVADVKSVLASPDPEARNRLIAAHLDRLEGDLARTRAAPAELAIMLHRGSLRNVDLTYGELGAHVIEHEISVEGQLREHHLIGFLDTDDSGQWVTEIGWPIFRSAA